MVYTPVGPFVNGATPALSEGNLNIMEQGIIDAHDAIAALGTTGYQGPEVIVASSGASTAIKASADFVCDGTADQTEINQAIDAAFLNGASGRPVGVVLVGGPGGTGTPTAGFRINGPILMKSGVQLRGLGLGTTIVSVGMASNTGMIQLAGIDHHMTSVRDLTLHGNSTSGGLSHGFYYVQSSGGNDGNTGTYAPGNSPDASHRILNVFVKAFQGGTRHGVYMADNVRDANVQLVRVADVSGNGFYMNGASDGKYTQCIAIACNVGWEIGGGSNQFVQCKTAYAVSNGWNVSSSRAHLTGCHSQDSGGHGYNVTGATPTLTSCVADSNSRLSTTAYALVLSSDDAVVEGFHCYDRAQTETSPQDRCIQFSGSPANIYVAGLARLRSTVTGAQPAVPGSANFINGAPGGNSFVRIVRSGSSTASAVYAVG